MPEPTTSDPKPDPADCDAAFRRLYDYLDGELAPPDLAAIDAHLAICARCSAEFGFESKVLDAIRSRARDARLPAGLRDRIRAALDRADDEPPR